MASYVIGIDYGTDSARAVLVDVTTGAQVATSVMDYPRWGKGLYCDSSSHQFRQHPLDYVECLEAILKGVVEQCPDASAIKGIGIDTTACTPCFCDENLTPLAMLPGFEDDPDAMFHLWKDHTAVAEADYITEKAHNYTPDYTSVSGGSYSPECFWPKILHTLRKNERVREAGYAAIEQCDFISATLTGCKSIHDVKIGHCAPSVKHMWSAKWGGYPSDEFLAGLDPVLVPFKHHLPEDNYSATTVAGKLCAEWAAKTGLSEDVVVTVGNVDGHTGSIGAGVQDGTIAMTLGTSSCYMAVMPVSGRVINGLFGQAEGCIIEGLDGLEAGMSAYGDIFAWFKKLVCWPLHNVLDTSDPVVAKAVEAAEKAMLPMLEKAAAALPLSEKLPFATDYFNGRRTPKPDNNITASISQLRLGDSAPEVYRALVEASAFGTRAIIDHFADNGVRVDRLVAVGGIPQKSPLIMQILSDVLGKAVEVSDCEHSCAFGSAIHASVAAGFYADVPAAQSALCPPVQKVYVPDMDAHAIYDKRYALYKSMSEHSER